MVEGEGEMKLIIAGSRSITSPLPLLTALFLSGWEEEVREEVRGAARGMDTVGEEWAKGKGLPLTLYPAQWNTRGGIENG
jgi:hypothetical protein